MRHFFNSVFSVYEDVAIVAHANLNIKNYPEISCSRDSENISKIFETIILEGFVFVDPISGEYFKLRANMMVQNCAHDRAQIVWKNILKSGRTQFLNETLELETDAKFLHILNKI